MSKPKKDRPINEAEALRFAFAFGVKLTLRALGLEDQNEVALYPILDKMSRIVDDKEHLVAAHDDLDMDAYYFARELERDLCQSFLQDVLTKSGETTENENDEANG